MHWNCNTGTVQQFVQLHDNWILLMVMLIRFSHGRYSLRARNCAYLTFQYICAKPSLHIPLYPTTAILIQSQTYATSIPKSQAMEYFKSAHQLCILCAFEMTFSSNKIKEPSKIF